MLQVENSPSENYFNQVHQQVHCDENDILTTEERVKTKSSRRSSRASISSSRRNSKHNSWRNSRYLRL
eukprot:Pgem_evm1s15899